MFKNCTLWVLYGDKFCVFSISSLIRSIYIWLSRSLSRFCYRTDSCSTTSSLLHINIQLRAQHFICKARTVFPGVHHSTLILLHFIYHFDCSVTETWEVHLQIFTGGPHLCCGLSMVLAWTMKSPFFPCLIMSLLNSKAPPVSRLHGATFDHFLQLPLFSFLDHYLCMQSCFRQSFLSFHQWRHCWLLWRDSDGGLLKAVSWEYSFYTGDVRWNFT